MEQLWTDIRYSIRQLAHTPSFTITAVLALTLGIGSVTAILTVLEAVVLRPLPYAQSDRLVMIWDTNTARSVDHETISPVNFLDYQAAPAFEDAAVWWKPDFTLTTPGTDPVRIDSIETSSNLFDVLGVQPALGAGFDWTPGTPLHAPGNTQVVISHRLWSTQLRGDSDIVGKTIQLNSRPYTILGVMPGGFHFPGNTDLWQRLQWDLTQHSRGAHFMESVARLKPGTTVDQASRDIDAVTARLRTEFPATNADWGARVVTLQDEVVGFYRSALALLTAAVLVLLLIACINVANMLLARAGSRSREVHIRSALGASRSRIIAQFLVESMVLSTGGGILGTLAAWMLLLFLVRSSPVAIPRLDQVQISGEALLIALATTLITAILFGLLPALTASRTDLQQHLKESGRASTISRAGTALRRVLVSAEVALSVVLLIGAGLLIRSVLHLIEENPGFRPEAVITANIQLPFSYRDLPSIERFHSRLVESLAQKPEVAAAGAANFLPLEAGWRVAFLVSDQPRPRRGEEPQAQHHTVSEGYFAALGVPVLQGRDFDARDSVDRPPVAIVNQAFADQFFPGSNPVGRTLIGFAQNIGPLGGYLYPPDSHGRTQEIVGVVGNVKNRSLRDAAEPAVFLPQRQFPFRSMNVVVRGRGSVEDLRGVLRRTLAEADAGIALHNFRAMDRVLAQSYEQPRFIMFLMAGFAALALILATVGVYGVLSYVIGQRRREFSIRVALGATRRDILLAVFGQGLTLTMAGVLIGSVGGLVFSRAMPVSLFGVSAIDPLSFAVAAGVTIFAGLAACAIPARHALRARPVAALRAE